MEPDMDTITIYVDGGCRGNHQLDGRQAYGSFAVFFQGEQKRHTALRFAKAETNNEAEYGALLAAIQYISDLKDRAHCELPDIQIKMDSELVITQLSGAAQVKAANLMPLHQAASAWLLSNPGVEIHQITGDEMKQVLGH
jgi:ribonuclease HI